MADEEKADEKLPRWLLLVREIRQALVPIALALIAGAAAGGAAGGGVNAAQEQKRLEEARKAAEEETRRLQELNDRIREELLKRVKSTASWDQVGGFLNLEEGAKDEIVDSLVVDTTIQPLSSPVDQPASTPVPLSRDYVEQAVARELNSMQVQARAARSLDMRGPSAVTAPFLPPPVEAE